MAWGCESFEEKVKTREMGWMTWLGWSFSVGTSDKDGIIQLDSSHTVFELNVQEKRVEGSSSSLFSQSQVKPSCSIGGQR